MVQRAGRIDRLGSPSSAVHLQHVPRRALEELLGLVQKPDLQN